MNREYRVSLSDSDFRKLVSGGILESREPDGTMIKIALLDIGFDRMREGIDDAEAQATPL